MFLVFISAIGFGLYFDLHLGPFHFKLFKTWNALITSVCYCMGSIHIFILRYMDNKILKCYEIVKFFLKCFQFKMYVTVAVVVYIGGSSQYTICSLVWTFQSYRILLQLNKCILHSQAQLYNKRVKWRLFSVTYRPSSGPYKSFKCFHTYRAWRWSSSEGN